MSRVIDGHMHVLPFVNGQRDEMSLHGIGYGKVLLGARGRWRPGTRRGAKRLMPPSFEHSAVTPAVALEYLDWAGVDAAVLMQAPMYGAHNEYLAGVVSRHPDRFRAFGLVDPRIGDRAHADLEYVAAELGFPGIKLEPPDTPFFLDDCAYMPFWRRVSDLGLILAVDLGWNRHDDPYNYQIEQLENVIRAFPSMRVVVLHLGISRLWDRDQTHPFPVLQRTLKLSDYPNVWFEISGLQEFCEWEDYPYARAQEILKVTVDRVGAGRLIWGSDFPGIMLEAGTCSYPQCVNLIKNHCDFLSSREKDLILGENADKLYGF